jgi:mono/diheme cytochrome c family protein
MPTLFKVCGLIVAGLALAFAAASGAVYFISENRLTEKVDTPAESIAVPTDITSVQRGQHLASAVAVCVDCHGPNLAGKVFVDDRALGRIVAPNLTRGRGGVGTTSSNADLVRAIRYGIDPRGRRLLIMPSDDYNHFSDADLGAIIAYVRSLPAIDTALPANEIRPLGRVLFAVGQLPLQPSVNIDPSLPRPVSPRTGVTPEYGAYLALNAGCPGCHGPGLGGGRMPQAPPGTVPAANLTPTGLGAWAESDFLRVMRTGIRPDGRRLDPFMPWPYYAQMTDDELRAIWRFLQAIPARSTGSR